MEMLGIPARHTCECLTGNLHKGRHRRCLHRRAWSTVIPAVCWCESPSCLPARARSKGRLRGGDTAQWGTLAFPQPAGRISGFVSELWAGVSSCGCYKNPESGSLGGQWGELQTPEVVAPGWLEALAYLSLMTFRSQNVSPHRHPGGQGGGEEGHPSSHCAFTPCSASSAFYNLSSLFFLEPRNGKRPIILRQRFSPGCGGLTFVVAARCPPRDSLRVCSLCTENTPAATWLP